LKVYYYWASPLDVQRQAVKLSMDVLTGTGHEDVLRSLKEWRLDATLGTTTSRQGAKTLTFFAEPISPKALTTWMEFQDDLNICGQLDGETYVRAYFRLREILPDTFRATPLSPTAALAHLDAIHDTISSCEYPLNFSAFPWLRPLANVASCWKDLLSSASVDARIPASVICDLWINRSTSPHGAQTRTGQLDRDASMEPQEGSDSAHSFALSPVDEDDDEDANLSSTPKPPTKRDARTKHARQRLNSMRKKGIPLSPIVTALSRSPSVSSLSSGHAAPGSKLASVGDRMDHLIQAIRAVTSDEGPDSFEYLSSLSKASTLPKAISGLVSYVARAGLQSNNAALTSCTIPSNVKSDLSSLRDRVTHLTDTIASLRRQNFDDQDTIRSLRASGVASPPQQATAVHAPAVAPRSREFLARFAPGKKRKQDVPATGNPTGTQESKKRKTDTISVGESTDWSSLRDKAGVMASLDGKADFATVSKVLDLYANNKATTPGPIPSTSLRQTTLEGNTLTREETRKAEAMLGPTIKKISIPAPPPRARLTKASAVPLPRNSARVVMFWLLPGKTAPPEASSLTEEIVHDKLVRHISGLLPGHEALADSLSIERMEWTSDRTALRVWFQTRPNDNLLECISSTGSSFLFGDGWGGRASPIHSVSLLEVIAMDAPKMSEVTSSFENIWGEILSEKNTRILNSANRILAGYTAPADPSPGEPTLMHWEASPKARWINIVGGTGSLVLAVKDTAKFQIAERLVRKRLYYNGATYAIVPHLRTKITPQCVKCHIWGHHETVCRAKNRFCELCSDAHPTTLHDKHCVECAAEAFVSGAPRLAACPRKGDHLQCANCGEKGHGPRSKDCRIFKKRTDARFMKNFAPAIKQGTRIQNTRTKGGVVQAKAERDRMTRSGDATVTGVSPNTILITPPGTDLETRLARWARPRLRLIRELPRAVSCTSCLPVVTV
jgi:hypothetical protein